MIGRVPACAFPSSRDGADEWYVRHAEATRASFCFRRVVRLWRVHGGKSLTCHRAVTPEEPSPRLAIVVFSLRGKLTSDRLCRGGRTGLLLQLRCWQGQTISRINVGLSESSAAAPILVNTSLDPFPTLRTRKKSLSSSMNLGERGTPSTSGGTQISML